VNASPVNLGTDGPAPTSEWPSLRATLGSAAAVTLAVTVASYALDGQLANLGVAGTFLAATWWLVLGRDTAVIRAHGLSLGGLLEPEPLDGRHIAVSLLGALAWTLGLALAFFPPFAVGYATLWGGTRAFAWRVPPEWMDLVAGQIVVVALPEEAFFRGFLQSALDGRTTKRWRCFGAELGPGWLASAAIFAVGHFLTVPQPGRLAVFFPALLFGWLRARTGGIGAGVAFHAACNLFSAMLAFGFGLRAR